MHYNKAMLISVGILYSSFSFCQTLKYNVTLLGKKIGETTVEKKDSAGFTKYTLVSHTDAKIIGIEKKDDMYTEAVFDKEGRMVSSGFENQKNKKHLSTHAAWVDGKLNINKDGAKSSEPEPVTSSSLLLYFSVPKAHQKIFSERMGELVEINEDGNGKFRIAFNDYTALYTYQSGKLTELQMKDDGGQVIMKLVE